MSLHKYRRYLLLPVALCACLLLQLLRFPHAFELDIGEAFAKSVVFPLLLNPVALYNTVGRAELSFNSYLVVLPLYWGVVVYSYVASIRSKSPRRARMWALICAAVVLIPALVPGPVPGSENFRWPDIPS
jgi:hypothetical protein